ncbi:MAG: GTPase ObgE [Bacilli bacterium]|nr:GTPase ObgE [Bacilli bacterium]
MFADEVKIYVEAGKGGDGCTSFRREKFIEMGGPNGGNGGHGANIIFATEPGLKTLIDLKMMKHVKGHKGINGQGSNKNGSNAEDVIIKVPMGTTITNLDTNEVIADLTKEGESVVIARGGRGGRGNRAFANHENPAPRMSELGEPGESLMVKCELKVLADVGLVGMPSVGKSTLISMISNCNPKIGAYHFTTLNPNLGVIKLQGGRNFVMADLPGLIEGASEGIGLGHKFLRHAMRTKVIAHVLDMGATEGRNPSEDFEKIVDELEKYDQKLIEKPHIIIANKMDIEGSRKNLDEFKKKYPEEVIYPISAINNEGLDAMIEELANMVDSLDEVELYDNDTIKESHILYKYRNERPFTIKRENDLWVLSGKEVETLFYMTRFDEDESVERFGRKLRGMGVEEELEHLGAKRGDEVKILDYIFIFKN